MRESSIERRMKAEVSISKSQGQVINLGKYNFGGGGAGAQICGLKFQTVRNPGGM